MAENIAGIAGWRSGAKKNRPGFLPETEPGSESNEFKNYIAQGIAQQEEDASAQGLYREVPEAVANPELAKAGGESTRSRIGRALQAASAAIQANVGPTYPGMGLGSALARGVVGFSAADAAKARADAAAAEKQATREQQLQMLGIKEAGDTARMETPERAAAKAGAVSDAEYANKEKLANLANTNYIKRTDALKKGAVSAATSEQAAKWWGDSWDDAIVQGNAILKSTGDFPDDAKLAAMAQRNFENRKNPPAAPKLRKL